MRFDHHMKRIFNAAPIIIFIVIGIIIVAFTPRSLTWPSYLTFTTLQSRLKYNMIFDVRELDYYREEGSWFRQNYIPYVDKPFEYPALATLFFTLPALMSESKVGYHVWFHIFTLFAGLALLVAVKYSIPHERRALLFLLVTPSVLFYTFHRFDVVAALFLQLSLYLLYRQRWRWSFVLLAASVLVKWYAGVLFPIYLFALFDTAHTLEERRRGFTAVCISIGILALGHVWPVAFGGNILTMVNPYAIHFLRSPEVGSLMSVFAAPFGIFYAPAYQIEPGSLDGVTAIIVALSSLLQWAGLVMVMIVLPRRPRPLNNLPALAHAALIAVGCFIFFNRVYSFQWILWIIPLLILTLPSRATILYFIAFDVISYIQSPILYGSFDYLSHFIIFLLLTILRSILLGVILLPSFRWLLRSESSLSTSPPITVNRAALP